MRDANASRILKVTEFAGTVSEIHLGEVEPPDGPPCLNLKTTPRVGRPVPWARSLVWLEHPADNREVERSNRSGPI